MERAPRRVWGDEVRARMHVGIPLPVVRNEMPENHFHIWVERSWGGTISPRLATMNDVADEMRDLLIELGEPETKASGSFPFRQIFIHVPDAEHPDRDHGHWLNAVVKECDGHIRNGRSCNQTDGWR